MAQLWPIKENTANLPSGWELEVAREARVVRIYLVEVHRKARGHPSRQWHAAKASLSLEDAKLQIELHRCKGSSWTIHETPACAFVGTAYSVLVVPSGPLRYDARTSPFLTNITSALSRAPFRFVTDSKEFEPAAKSLRWYSSLSSGAQYPLSWLPGNAFRGVLAPIRKLIATHEKSLSECAFLGVQYASVGKAVIIRGFHPNSPLLSIEPKARKGDLICDVEINTEEVSEDNRKKFPSVAQALARAKPGDHVVITLVRGKKSWKPNISPLGSFDGMLGRFDLKSAKATERKTELRSDLILIEVICPHCQIAQFVRPGTSECIVCGDTFVYRACHVVSQDETRGSCEAT